MTDTLPPEDKLSQGIPIEWHIPDDITLRYATNFVVQHTEREFILSFFEITPPIVLGDEDEQRRAFAQMNSVRARCVGRIVCTPDRAVALIEILQQNLEVYGSRHLQEDKSDNDS